MVSRPVYVGGLDFGLKWNMRWMHDTLKYCVLDPRPLSALFFTHE